MTTPDTDGNREALIRHTESLQEVIRRRNEKIDELAEQVNDRDASIADLNRRIEAHVRNDGWYVNKVIELEDEVHHYKQEVRATGNDNETAYLRGYRRALIGLVDKAHGELDAFDHSPVPTPYDPKED